MVKKSSLVKRFKGKPSKGLFGEIGKGIRHGTKERLERKKEEIKEREERDVHGMRVGKTKRKHTRWYWR